MASGYDMMKKMSHTLLLAVSNGDDEQSAVISLVKFAYVLLACCFIFTPISISAGIISVVYFHFNYQDYVNMVVFVVTAACAFLFGMGLLVILLILILFQLSRWDPRLTHGLIKR